jgi:outer membrane biosynthesis protein TonB
VIRFSAFLVVVAVGTLVGGVVTSKLLLVYIAIGVSGVALLALGIGAAVNWRELTGKPATAPAPAAVPPAAPAVASATPASATPASATPASRPAWPVTVAAGSSRSGYLPTEPPPRPAPPSPWERRDAPAEPPAPDDDPSIQDQTLIFPAQDPAPAVREPEPAPAPEPAPEPAAEPEPAADDAATEPPGDPDLEAEVTVVPGVPRYHKGQCILIRFMGDSDLDTMTVAAAREAGCTPCRACLPEQSDEPAE